ncbi:MAG TPA: CvpA family protein [Aestuariivirgaceae bacterium]|jgi:membrane protein required for colicin V production
MPFQLLDLILVGIMIISGLLALMRGFTREVLSLLAWGIAGLAALGAVLSPELNQLAAQYLQPEIVAKIALGGGVFLIVLIIMSLISVRIADWVLDSAAGAFDRTMGFVYGVARGLLLVAIAYLFYVWLVPEQNQEEWIRDARLLPVVKEVSTVVISFLPADVADVLRNKTYVTDQDNAPAQPAAEDEEGYQAGQQQNLNRLIESTDGSSQGAPQDSEEPDSEPVFGGQSTTGQ